MPGSWEDAEEGGEESPLVPPVHPDDRLWRHPSELAWSGRGAAATPAPPSGAGSGSADRPAAGPRLWVLTLTAGLTGAALTLGALAVVAGLDPGGTERVVERVGVRDQLVDPLSAGPGSGLSSVAATVTPSVVRLEVGGAGGDTVGSGIVVLDDGHILTTAQVVDGATDVTIVLADGSAVAGRVVGVDPVTDIAVVAPRDATAGPEWVPAVRGPASELAVGDPAVAVGSPAGTSGSPSITLGVVSALGRRVTTATGGVLHGMIETDAPVAAGSSGGALCDRLGRVVGITTAPPDAEADGMGYATPMEAAWAVAEALMADGAMHHVWLGVEGADLDATRSSILGISAGGGGVAVDRVVEGGPAATAGLQPGDVLLAVDGHRLATMSELVMVLRGYAPGDEVTFVVHRAGADEQVTVTLGERSG